MGTLEYLGFTFKLAYNLNEREAMKG